MKVMKRITLVVVVLLLAFCVHLETPKQRYAAALDSYDAMMDAYQAERVLQPPEVQRDWDLNIAPVLLEGATALRAWKDSLDDAGKERAYLAAKAQVRRLLVQYGVILAGEEVSK